MNNKNFIKFLIIAVLIIAAVFVLYKVFTYTEPIEDSEAQRILSELVPKAEEINDIIWGRGLPVAPGQDEALKTVTAAQYRLVAEDSAYKSTDELRKGIAEVYSSDFIAKTIEYAAFKGEEDALEDTVSQMYPRYKDNDAGKLLVDITNEGFELTTKIDPLTAKVVGAKGNKQTIEVKATVGEEQVTLTLVIVDQDEGWRLDTPTY